MKNIILMLLFCHVSSSEKHLLRFFFTASTGIPDLPEFMFSVLVNDIEMGYCNSKGKFELKQNTWKKLFDDEHLKLYKLQCFEALPIFYKNRLNDFLLFNQTHGVHYLQVIQGCELDDETEEVTGFSFYCYDGTDIMSYNIKNFSWTALKPQAAIIKQKWDAEEAVTQETQNLITRMYPDWLKMFLNYPVKTVPPSVSLLRQSPSSPVSCHATGFYPDRGQMFWRKDGEEIHEDVDQGEILPNQDGTFQMRVDLNISADEDWSRYECVFQLSGVDTSTVMKLDKEVVKTNCGKYSLKNESEFPTAAVSGVIVGLLLLALCITGLFIWKQKNRGFTHANASDSSVNPASDN